MVPYMIEKVRESHNVKFKLKREEYDIFFNSSTDNYIIMEKVFEKLLEKIDTPYNSHKIGTKIIINDEKHICIEFLKPSLLTGKFMVRRMSLFTQSSRESTRISKLKVIFTFIKLK